ncbi:unnamed protein product [Periconia digitata]|uniref:Zn(2)-C6 fungal-type domain-containing protein n=1 Tax=Periconia digitata TaxID=1303443 RepID=A0A9W4UET4_9PLEO|nr:unnamed protein product [Periconia digitata]
MEELGRLKPRSLACERCHSQRRRCRFDPGTVACVACGSNRVPCQERKQKRMGRRPVVHKVPSGAGAYLVMDSHMGGSSSESSDLTAANWASGDSPAYDTLHIYLPMSLTSEDQMLQRTLRTRRGFFRVHRLFLVGESFADDFQRTVTSLTHHAPEVLPRGYMAVLQLMNSQRDAKSRPGMDLTLGCSSLQSFRNKTTSSLNIEGAAVVLILGQLLLAYNAILWLSATRTIAQSTLLAIQHCYPALRQRPEYDCLTITPVFIDIIDSLLRRQVPILRPPETTRHIVDRCCGVFSSLLPILYDLCHRSHAIKTNSSSKLPHADPANPYADIEEKIESWTPRYPPDFFKRYPPAETTAMLAIAAIYQKTALLVIHRLRFPLRTNDDHGKAAAHSILDHVLPFSKTSTEGATGLNLDFPLLVATVELPSRGAAIAALFEPLRFCKAQLESNLGFVERVWKARDEGFQGSWLDLVEGVYVGDVLP